MKTLINKDKIVQDLIKAKHWYEYCEKALEDESGFFTILFSEFTGYAIASMRISFKLCEINDLLLQCELTTQTEVELSRLETILIYELKTLKELKE